MHRLRDLNPNIDPSNTARIFSLTFQPNLLPFVSFKVPSSSLEDPTFHLSVPCSLPSNHIKLAQAVTHATMSKKGLSLEEKKKKSKSPRSH